MSMNIVLLSGSPRKDGNTDKLAAAFAGGAESAGKSVTLYRVADMRIGGCMGCMSCFEENGVCVQKDDMPQVLDALRKADAIVLASPVYYWGVTAQLKLAIDRTFALNSDRPPIKRAAMLMTCGDGGTEAAASAVMMYNNICFYYRWDNAGVVVAGGLHGKDDIIGRDELNKARNIGMEI